MHFMLTLLKGLASYSERPLYKEYVGSPENPRWRTITYSTFLHDLEASATYFQQQLRKLGVEHNDVVGLWYVSISTIMEMVILLPELPCRITGSRYEDLVNLYAIIRAGFVPQVFSLVMATQGGIMINELLALQEGKVLILDPHYKDHVPQITVPTLVIPDFSALPALLEDEKLLDLPEVDDDAIAMIFHTSGTTSGRPKPVPESHKWLRYQSDINWPRAWQSEGKAQKCFNNVGSLANVASATIINKVVPSGHCIIRTSKPDFDAAELLAMINVEGLNNMLLYANRLSLLLGIARTNPDVLEILRNMQQISYTGEALNPDDIRWIIEQGLPVVIVPHLVVRAIEDAVNLHCADLVQNCVVVGYCKPIVLFVEPTAKHADSTAHPSKLQSEIIKRMVEFQAGLFPHERFDDRVAVVARGKLPRTSDKGNIRRNAVEAAFADVLKDIYSRK
ncbi:hypothetical protein C0993_004976 [Termitomyces sp. T159_Od127]|nr:hypothetical protein C0993_004976 [Termitomyces sp. T159_Od127]